VILVVFILQQDAQEAKFLESLRRDGVETTGRVVGRHTRSGRHQTYYVDYDYRVGRVGGHRGSWVSQRDYEAIPDGTSLPVTYLAATPDVSRPIRKADLTDDYLSRARRRYLPLAGLALAMYVLLGLPVGLRVKRARELAARGIAVPALLLSAARRGKSTVVVYQLQNEPSRKSTVWDCGKASYVPGDTISMLVDPNDRSNVMPYAAITRLVRIHRSF
jgi:hypothetical protein